MALLGPLPAFNFFIALVDDSNPLLEAAAVASDLRDPRPHGFRRCVNIDGSRDLKIRRGDEFVAGQFAERFA